MLPLASRVLPAASSFTTVCNGPLPLWRRLASPDRGTPASTLPRAMFRSTRPCNAASRSPQTRRSSNTSAASSTSISAWPFNRCGPLRQGESAGPDHHGSGSKSTSVAWPWACHGARSSVRCNTPEADAFAPPADATKRRMSTRCAVALASTASCTARAGPRRCTAPVNSALRSSVRRSATSNSRPMRVTGPLSCISAARASSRFGCRPESVASSCHCCGVQRPPPVMRPAGCCVVPSSACSVCKSSVRGSFGRARSSSFNSRNGSLPSFQRPA